MIITTSKSVMINGAELVFFHLEGKDLHLDYVWKGGERTGMYKVLQASKCMETGLCSRNPYPLGWKMSPEEKDRINQLLGKAVFVVLKRVDWRLRSIRN